MKQCRYGKEKMNTPKPCDTCKHLYWDCMCEDQEDYVAECKLDHYRDLHLCPDYEHYLGKIKDDSPISIRRN
jgi:hypothetical protein